MNVFRAAHRRTTCTTGLFALLLTAALEVSAPLAAQAQTATGTAQARIFNIPASPLTDALVKFGFQSGLQVAADSALVGSATSPGVSGSFAPLEALSRLLQGTGLTFHITSVGAVQLARAPQASSVTKLAPIRVQGRITDQSTDTLDNLPPAYAGGEIARGGHLGMLGTKDVMDTPYSVTDYTHKTIENQQARTVQDVVANDPSFLNASNTTGGDFTTIRGFTSQGAGFTRSLNGMPGMAPPQYPSLDYIERVEVLRGPGALLKGMSLAGQANQGGSVDMVTKQAGDTPLTQLTTRYESNSKFGTHIDVGRRFGDDKQFGIRFNGSADAGNTAVDKQTSRSKVGALNLDYRGDRVRLSADFVYQYNKVYVPYNTVVLGGVSGVLAGIKSVPDAPDGKTDLGAPWSYTTNRSKLAMIQGEVDLTDNITAYAGFGAQRWDYTYWGAATNGVAQLDTNGTLGVSSTQANRSRGDVTSMQGGLRAKALTGPISHAFNLNLSRLELNSYAGTSGCGYTFTATSTASCFTPVGSTQDFGHLNFPSPDVSNLSSPPRSNDTVGSSVALADTMSILDDRIQLTVGARHQQIESRNFSATTGDVTSDYNKSKWTPSYALVVKPWKNVSLYADYIEDLVAGSIVGSGYANTGEAFTPYTTKQYETGIKVDWGSVTTTLAAFQISKPSTIAESSTTGGLSTLALDGEQRNRGIELTAYGEPAKGVRLLSGLTYLDARQVRTAGGTYDGKRAAGAPDFRAVLGAEWDTPFVQGLTLTGRVSYTSDAVVANSRPDLTVPSWTQVDVGARYTVDSPWNHTPITLRFDIDNVFNKHYWVVGFPTTGNLYLGAPRTFRLSATFNF